MLFYSVYENVFFYFSASATVYLNLNYSASLIPSRHSIECQSTV